MKKYYDLQPLLNKKDLDNNTPDIYLIESNRSDGKTTAVLRYLDNVTKSGKQIGLIYRHKYELKGCEEIFKTALELNESNIELESVPHAQGLFYEIIAYDIDENKKQTNPRTYGFAFTLNSPDELKKYSPLFADVDALLFDEFQLENGNKYLPKESQKLLSLLTSIARGNGSQARPIKLFMCANKVSMMNPYYIEFGIYKRKKADTHFLRGHGWVAEFNFNPHASEEIKNTGFGRAFSENDYIKYATEDTYLIDSEIFIEKPKGKARYICTISHDGVNYGVRECYEAGVVHVSKKPDNNYPYVITFKASNHTQNTIMLNHYSFLWKNIRDAFQGGYLRFDDLQTKNAIFDILSIDLYK